MTKQWYKFRDVKRSRHRVTDRKRTKMKIEIDIQRDKNMSTK